ncbi:hypothetical protein [Roseiconus lacunae]|uniref:Uncharacterized protein n=1 Tax=Roseiconus lacunae TaxID=2605694 RepID=A0ABT7PEJ7_9BACT|nr:hypothetical protein [Roseiconus lacunae]MDM4014651.1 hypothetical protein [Roseiconus lacunae]
MTSKHQSARWALIVTSLLLFVINGCGQDPDPKTLTTMKPHGHHGGHAAAVAGDSDIELELTLDEEGRRMVIYVQESGEHQPYPLPVDQLNGKFESRGDVFEVSFQSDPRSDESRAFSSRYALSLDKLPQQLVATNHFVLKLSYSMEGNTFSAAIPHSNDHTHEYHHD